jgi:hypothetical protein
MLKWKVKMEKMLFKKEEALGICSTKTRQPKNRVRYSYPHYNTVSEYLCNLRKNHQFSSFQAGVGMLNARR